MARFAEGRPMARFAIHMPSRYDSEMDQPEKITSMNVSLPESLRAFAEERAGQGFSSASEYIRELIRSDQKVAAKEKLEALLIEGLESGKPIVVTEDYWAEKRQKLTSLRGKKRGKSK